MATNYAKLTSEEFEGALLLDERMEWSVKPGSDQIYHLYLAQADLLKTMFDYSPGMGHPVYALVECTAKALKMQAKYAKRLEERQESPDVVY